MKIYFFNEFFSNNLIVLHYCSVNKCIVIYTRQIKSTYMKV